MLRNSKVLNEVYIPIHGWCGTERGITGEDNTFLEVRRNVDNNPDNLISKDLYVINKIWLHYTVVSVNSLSIAIRIDVDFNEDAVKGVDFSNLGMGLCFLFRLSDFLKVDRLNRESLSPYNISLKNIKNIDNRYRLYSTTNLTLSIWHTETSMLTNGTRLPAELSDNGINTSTGESDLMNNLRIQWKVSNFNLIYDGLITNKNDYINYTVLHANVSIHYMNDIFAMDNYEALKKNFQSRVLNIQTLPYYIN